MTFWNQKYHFDIVTKKQTFLLSCWWKLLFQHAKKYKKPRYCNLHKTHKNFVKQNGLLQLHFTPFYRYKCCSIWCGFFSSTMFCGVVLVLWGIAYTIGLQVVVLNTSVYLQGKRIEDYFHHFWNIMSSFLCVKRLGWYVCRPSVELEFMMI